MLDRLSFDPLIDMKYDPSQGVITKDSKVNFAHTGRLKSTNTELLKYHVPRA